MVGLPFFKFFCSEWIQGEITGLDLAPQGLFVNICAHYWFKDCKLSLQYCRKIPFFNQTAFDELVRANLIKVTNDQISITFLNVQWESRIKKRVSGQTNGKKGGRPKKPKNNPTKTENKTQTEPNTKDNRIDIPLRGDRYVGVNIGLDSEGHGNGSTNSDRLTALWGRLSSKVNLSSDEIKNLAEAAIVEIEKIEASPSREKIWELIEKATIKMPADFTADCIVDALSFYRQDGEGLLELETPEA